MHQLVASWHAELTLAIRDVRNAISRSNLPEARAVLQRIEPGVELSGEASLQQALAVLKGVCRKPVANLDTLHTAFILKATLLLHPQEIGS